MIERHRAVLALVRPLTSVHSLMSLHVPVEVEHFRAKAAGKLLFELVLHVNALDVHAKVTLARKRASTLRTLERKTRVRIADVFGDVKNFNRADLTQDFLCLLRQLMKGPHV